MIRHSKQSTFPTIDILSTVQNPQEIFKPLDFDVTRAKQKCAGEKGR